VSRPAPTGAHCRLGVVQAVGFLIASTFVVSICFDFQGQSAESQIYGKHISFLVKNEGLGMFPS
jgi:hypothetical protein